jgi:hypothetical protein
MFSLKSKWVAIPFLASGFLSILLFQNCAHQKSPDQSEVASYSSGALKISLPANSQITADTCFEGQFKCYRKVYSPNLSDTFSSSTECLGIEDREVCLQIDVNTYDTREALSSCTDCDASEGQTNGRYNREEITCWLHVGVPENPSFFSIKTNIKDALSDTINSCRISLLSKGDQ